MRLRWLLLVLWFVPLAPPAAGQTATISGYVRDAATGETLLGANVAVLGTSRGAATNSSGYYIIPDVPADTLTLVASYVGYERFETTVVLQPGETRRLDIALQPTGIRAEEVVVTDARAEDEASQSIGVTSIDAALVKQLPTVLQPDLFRALQRLPGIKSASDFSSGLYVRGGSPDQTLILLDRTTVYNPTHFFGLFSAFNPDAIKDVTLYKGSYPATYGGRLGSVLAVYNKEGNRRQTVGGLSLGLLSGRAYVEGPLDVRGDSTAEGSYMVAVRRSTLEPLLAALRSANVDGIPDSFSFYDVNAKATYRVGPNDTVTLGLYGGQDFLNIEFLADGRFDIQYGNQTVSSTWTHLFSNTVFANLTGTFSRYLSTPVATINGTRFTQRNEVIDASLKGDVEWTPSPVHTVKAGFWTGALSFGLRNTFDGSETFQQDVGSAYTSVYVQDRYRPAPAWEITAGLRGNYFASGPFWRVAPRLAVDYQLTPQVRLQAAGGRYYQFITLESSELFTGFDTWLIADEGVPPSWGDQLALGVKAQLTPSWRLDVEAYGRTMNDLFELNPFLPDRAGLPYADAFRFGEGRAYGLEVLLRKGRGRLTGLLGYTLSRTERKFPFVNVSETDGPQFYTPKFDRTHDVTLTATYDLSRHWTLTSAFNFATGQPYTEPQFRYTLNDPFSPEVQPRVVLVSPFNAERLPPYHRLDVGIERAGTWWGSVEYTAQLQVINAYGRRNPWFYLFEFENDGTVTRTEVPQIPVPLPNLSLTLTF